MPRRKNYNRKNVNRRPRKMLKRRPRRNVKKLAIMAGETKLLKNIQNRIDHGATIINDSHLILTPYCPQAAAGSTDIGNWSQFWNVAPTNVTANFINQGTSFNERIGRRVHILKTHCQLQFGLIPGYPSTLPPENVVYPSYPVIRVVHGWVKKGWEHLEDLRVDCPNLYSEIPYSKYKIKSDRTYTLEAKPSTSFGGASTFTGEDSVYRPIKISRSFSPNRSVVFGQTNTSGFSTSNGAFSGWCPFVMIMNPQHGNGVSSLALDVTYARRLLTFKDA